MNTLLIQHQSYGITGEGEKKVQDIFKKVGLSISLESNPDFYHRKFETLTIDDSREIKEVHASKPFSSDFPRIFIIEFHGITREAQNALLKVLEEPSPNNFFFLLMPSLDILLPTLRSRLHTLELAGAKKETSSFLGLSLKEKISFVDEMAQSISDDVQAKHTAMGFVSGVEAELYALYSKEKKPETKALFAKKFAAISKTKTYLNDRAPSVKMLLEYVALSV